MRISNRNLLAHRLAVTPLLTVNDMTLITKDLPANVHTLTSTVIGLRSLMQRIDSDTLPRSTR